MPNTEVKLLNVDDTWWETARESRKLPEPKSEGTRILAYLEKNKYSFIAQSVERMTVNHDVAGSSPAGGAKKEKYAKRASFFGRLSQPAKLKRHYSSANNVF